MPEETPKQNVVDISKFFGGKTLASSDVRVNKNQVLKTQPSFIAAPELASLLDVVATSVEDKNNALEKIKSDRRSSEIEREERSRSDNKFQQAIASLMSDVGGLKLSYGNILKTLENDRKLREQEVQDEQQKIKILKAQTSKAERGSSYGQSTAIASQSFSGQIVQEEQQKNTNSEKKFLGGILGATAVGGGLLSGLFNPSDDTGDGDPGQVDPNYKPPSGKSFNVGQLKELALGVGFNEKNASIAAAVAMAESGGDSSNDTIKSGLYARNGETSYGLWQINMTGALGPERIKQLGLSSYKDLYDPVTNAKAAFKLSGGSNWSPWSAYNDGKHLPFLKDAQTHKKAGTAPAAPVLQPPAASGQPQASAASPAASGQSQASAAMPNQPSITPPISPQSSQVASAPPTVSPTEIKSESGMAPQSPPVIVAQTPSASGSMSNSSPSPPSQDLTIFSSINGSNLYATHVIRELNIVPA